MTKVQSASLHFFLGSEEMEESGDEDEVRIGFMIILKGLMAVSRQSTSKVYGTDAR